MRSLLLAGALVAVPVLAMPQGTITVEEGAIATDVVDRQPTGSAQTFSATVGQVVCWTKVAGAMAGTQIQHVWYWGDREMARVSLEVGAETWRTWSQKTILPEWTGQWRVDVVAQDGGVLRSFSFTIQ